MAEPRATAANGAAMLSERALCRVRFHRVDASDARRDDPSAGIEDLQAETLDDPADLEHAAATAGAADRRFREHGEERAALDEHAASLRIQHGDAVAGIAGVNLERVERREAAHLESASGGDGFGEPVERHARRRGAGLDARRVLEPHAHASLPLTMMHRSKPAANWILGVGGSAGIIDGS